MYNVNSFNFFFVAKTRGELVEHNMCVDVLIKTISLLKIPVCKTNRLLSIADLIASWLPRWVGGWLDGWMIESNVVKFVIDSSVVFQFEAGLRLNACRR